MSLRSAGLGVAWALDSRLVERRARASGRWLGGPDRLLLERTIFRALFVDHDVRRILFAGCSRFTSWYPSLFRSRPGVLFATADPDPEARVFGSRRHHFTTRFETLAEQAELAGSFDVVFLNGVFGYGTDTEDDKRSAVGAASELLRSGGRLVIGYNSDGATRDLTAGLVPESLYEPAAVPGLGEQTIETGSASKHVYACWIRK